MKFQAAKALFKCAESQPDEIALIEHDRSSSSLYISYSQLCSLVRARSNFLKAEGYGPGSVVALRLRNGARYVEWCYAIWDCGAIVIPIPVEWKEDEVRRVEKIIRVDAILDEGTGCALAQGERIGTLDDEVGLWHRTSQVSHPEGFNAEETAFIRFTSGTTNEAKGVVIQHETIGDRIIAANEVLKINTGDRVVWVLSMAYHFTVSIVSYLTFGATVVCCKNGFGMTVSSAIREHHGTVLYASPMHYRYLCEISGEPLGNFLRLALITTAACDVDLAKRFREKHGIGISNVYGIIEVGLPFIDISGTGAEEGHVGRCLPSMEYQLLDVGMGDNLKAIQVRGPGFADAYYYPWRNREEFASGGWFMTGDLGYINSNGNLKLMGRHSEVLNVGGRKFAPNELEEVLETHPDVDEALIRDRHDDMLGQVPIALIKTTEQSTLDEDVFKSWIIERVSSEKVPVEIHFVNEIPKTTSGKKIRRES